MRKRYGTQHQAIATNMTLTRHCQLAWMNADMYRRSGLVTSSEQGMRYDAGLAVSMS